MGGQRHEVEAVDYSDIAAVVAVRSGADGQRVLVTVGPYSGATMLFENAGGYMLLAVAAFMTGVVVTAALIKKRNRTETEIKQEERRS